MDGLDGDHVVTPTVTSRNNRGALFSVCGRCFRFIIDKANRLLGVETWRFEDLKTLVEDLRSCKGNVVWPEEELED
jgi:hypothetical protein